MRRYSIVGVSVLFFVVASIAIAQSPLQLVWSQQCDGEVRVRGLTVECWQDALAPTATPEPTPAPTATPEPTAAPTPTTQPGAFADSPACATHDPRAWHELYDFGRGCHYDHSHGNVNPHSMDDVFGTEVWTWMGGEISYSWQTFYGASPAYPPPPTDPALYENARAHNGYVWFLYALPQDAACEPEGGSSGCVQAARALIHVDYTEHGAYKQFHSLVYEAKICQPYAAGAPAPDCGTIRGGGWGGFDRLRVDSVTILDRQSPAQHPQSQVVAYRNTGNPTFQTWYLRQPFAFMSTETTDLWGPISGEPTVPTGPRQEFSCVVDHMGYVADGCKFNSSDISIHAWAWDTGKNRTADSEPSSPLPLLDQDNNGRANWRGYTDRYGILLRGAAHDACVASGIGLDCVPFVVEDAPVGTFQFRAYDYTGEMDYHFDRQTSLWSHTATGESIGWIRFPELMH